MSMDRVAQLVEAHRRADTSISDEEAVRRALLDVLTEMQWEAEEVVAFVVRERNPVAGTVELYGPFDEHATAIRFQHNLISAYQDEFGMDGVHVDIMPVKAPEWESAL